MSGRWVRLCAGLFPDRCGGRGGKEQGEGRACRRGGESSLEKYETSNQRKVKMAGSSTLPNPLGTHAWRPKTRSVGHIKCLGRECRSINSIAMLRACRTAPYLGVRTHRITRQPGPRRVVDALIAIFCSTLFPLKPRNNCNPRNLDSELK